MLRKRVVRRPRAAMAAVAVASSLFLAALLAGVLGTSTFIGLLWADQALGIKEITPSAAHVGDNVTITGSGFGAKNLRITVGGINDGQNNSLPDTVRIDTQNYRPV